MTQQTGTRGRLPLMDRLPEFFTYRDHGCAVSPSCLRWPLERCVYEKPPIERAVDRATRDAEVYRLYRQRGPDVKGLAARFGISRRTVHRIIARLRQKESSAHGAD